MASGSLGQFAQADLANLLFDDRQRIDPFNLLFLIFLAVATLIASLHTVLLVLYAYLQADILHVILQSIYPQQ